MTQAFIRDRAGQATRGDLQQLRVQLIHDLEAGMIRIPALQVQPSNYAGGGNHCPNSDLSYSKAAATVAGTLPTTPGDANQEAYKFYRQEVGANLDLSASFTLKASGHSLYAGDEGMRTYIPIWNRVYGWVEMGSTTTQYDIAIQLLNKPVGPGQRWFVLFRIANLVTTMPPGNLEVFAGIWQKGSSEGWATGGAFDLSYEIVGIPGTQSVNYRVLAKTDSGVEILSNILNVPNAPDVISSSNYPKLFYHAGPGFDSFEIYREISGTFTFLFTVQNTTDFQYNDTNNTATHRGAQGWPTASGDSPQAYAQTRNLRVAPYGAAEWLVGELTIQVPSTYDAGATDDDGQFLRMGFTVPTAVDRQIGIDRIILDTNFHEWSPDPHILFPDGTTAVPSVSPPTGPQGGSGGLFHPPHDGSGGSSCLLTDTPIRTNRKWKQFKNIRAAADHLKGERTTPYAVLRKRIGTVAEYLIIKTKNGITIGCSKDHRFIDPQTRDCIEAQHIIEGVTKLSCSVKGRRTKTLVISKRLVPEAVEVGTFTLRDMGGLLPDGQGIYQAGRSKEMDRWLFNSNVKTAF